MLQEILEGIFGPDIAPMIVGTVLLLGSVATITWIFKYM
jgi:hypothetical protein